MLFVRVKCVKYCISQWLQIIIIEKPFLYATLILFKKKISKQQPLHCIQRILKLQTSLTIFQSNNNITVLSAISSVNLNQYLGIQFTYQLDSFNNSKILRYNITKKNQIIIPDQFFIQIDFLIAQNLRVGRLNMTSFQQHIQNMSLNQQQKDQRNKEVHNQLFLFLNGFSSINLTNSVMYSYIYSYDMYVIHYMTDKGEKLQQGWINQKYFIMFSSFFLPKYPFGNNSCKSVMVSHQKQNFTYQCNDKQVSTYFFGLSGFNSSMINAQFQLLLNGFIFNVKQKTNYSRYGIYAFPIKVSSKFKFIDRRSIKMVANESYINQNLTMIIVLLGLVTFLALCIVLYFRNNQNRNKQPKRNKGYADFQDQKQIGSFQNQSNKNSIKSQKDEELQKKIETQSSELHVEQF